jgi:uncharacterized protein YjiS (DUF1127 family)
MKSANMTLQNDCAGHANEPAAYLKPKLAAAGQLIHTWRQRYRTRLALSQLSPRLLEDGGIEPGVALRESNKPFWRA